MARSMKEVHTLSLIHIYTVIGSNKLWPTDTKTITTDDLSKLTQNEVAAVRNEIYARHGYTFTTDEWKIFFASAEWYHADRCV